MLEIATHRQPILESIATLLEALHGNDIAYCNLKGNDQHLRSALTGQSDVDILFDKIQKAKLELTLQKLGYKEFVAIREKRFKDVCDYFVLDEVSGKLIHLHAYFGFTFGEPFLKGYQPDVAGNILATRVYNNDYGLYCIHPAVELTLLYLTEVLKLRHRDALRRLFFKEAIFPGQKAVYQYHWLKARTTTDEIDQALHAMFPGHNALGTLAGSPFDGRQLRQLAPQVKRSLAQYRLYSPLHGLLTRWWRELSVKMRSKLSRVLRLPIPYRRSNPRGGKVVAFLETDVGVSAILFRALKDTFGRKIDLYQVAFANEFARDGEKGHPLGRRIRGISRACSTWLRSKQIDMAKKNGALVIYDFDPNGGVCPAALSEEPMRRNPVSRLLTTLQGSIESSAKKLCAPDIVLQFIPRDISGRPSDGKSPGTDHGYTVLSVGPVDTVTEKLDILKREIWNHL